LQCSSEGNCEVPNKEPTCGLEGQTCGDYESTECCPNLECKENVCTKPPEGAKCDKEGEECSSSSNCCSGLRCVGSICTSKTGEPIEPGECKKDGECCDPIECIQSKTNCCCSGGEACRMVLEEGGYWCNYEKKKCANAGEECGGETGCCNDLQCSSEGNCEVPNKEPTCGLEGQTCGDYESTECCPNLECKENVCTKPPEGAKCDKEGEECSSSSNCCSGLRCVGSICTSKTGKPIVPGECKKDGECCDPIECIQFKTNCCCSGGPACRFVLEEGGYWCNYGEKKK